MTGSEVAPAQTSNVSEPALATYFTNHRLGRRFPWSLYHRPIDRELRQFIGSLPEGSSVLNVGCGMFLNLPDLPSHVRYTGVDIDPRAIDACRTRYRDPDAAFEVSEPLRLPFADRSFDAVYATEVIEHCDEPERWLAELLRVLKPGGRAILPFPERVAMDKDHFRSVAPLTLWSFTDFTDPACHRLGRHFVDLRSHRLQPRTTIRRARQKLRQRQNAKHDGDARSPIPRPGHERIHNLGRGEYCQQMGRGYRCGSACRSLNQRSRSASTFAPRTADA